MGENTQEQQSNNIGGKLEKEKTKKKEWLAPFQFKPGQSGNPGGRPKGKTLKEYTREMLVKMTDEERQQFLKGLSKGEIWKMAEGLPQQDITSGGKEIQIPIYNGLSVNNKKNEKDLPKKQE